MKKLLIFFCCSCMALYFNGCAKQSPVEPKLNSAGVMKAVSSGTTETYEFVTKWGTYGNGDGQFYYTTGVFRTD